MTVETAFSTDGPTTALVDRSKVAGLVVVGARARGGFPWLRLGSTARAVALHAACPIAVVRPTARQTDERVPASELASQRRRTRRWRSLALVGASVSLSDAGFRAVDG